MGIPIYFGVKLYGRVQEADGTSVATQFFHIYYLPIAPIRSHRIHGETHAEPIALSGRSIATTYLQFWGLPAAAGLATLGLMLLADGNGAGWALTGLSALLLWMTVGSWFLLGRRRGATLSPAAKVALPLLLLIPSAALGWKAVEESARGRRMAAGRSVDDLADAFSKLLSDPKAMKDLAAAGTRDTAERQRARIPGEEQKCTQGVWQSCVYAGYYRYEGKDVPKDLQLAARYFDGACTHDLPWGCRGAGLVAFDGGLGVPADHARAAVAWEKACTLAEQDSCEKLARLYDTGDGVKKDSSKAKKLRKRACTLRGGRCS
jgi:hypothetical protein